MREGENSKKEKRRGRRREGREEQRFAEKKGWGKKRMEKRTGREYLVQVQTRPDLINAEKGK